MSPNWPSTPPDGKQNVENKRRYKLLRGQYARREFKDDSDKEGTYVHYQAGSILDTLVMTDSEALKFGTKYLAAVSDSGVIMPTQAQMEYIEAMKAAEVKAGQEKKAPWPTGE